MESRYSVGVSNRFSLLYDDDDDPSESVAVNGDKKMPVKEPAVAHSAKAKESQKDKHPSAPQASSAGGKRGSSSESKAANASAGKSDKSRIARNDQDARRGDGPARDQQRTGRFSDRRNRPPAPSRDRDEVFTSSSGQREEKTGQPRDNRLGGRGRGRGRGAFRGKREFDRRSGSDRSSIKPVEKREGSGGFNWGNVHDDLNAISPDDEWPSEEPEGTANGVAMTTDSNDAEEKQTSSQAEEKISVELEEMTLDEYRSKMSGRQKPPQYDQREVKDSGEQWKGSVMFQRNEDDYIPSQREVIEKIKTSGRKVTPVATSFHFKDPARRGRGRSTGGPIGRGGNRERRSSGGRRDHTPNMTDPEDFPALIST